MSTAYRSGRTAVIASALVFVGACAKREPSTQNQPHFSTPEQAASALVE